MIQKKKKTLFLLVVVLEFPLQISNTASKLAIFIPFCFGFHGNNELGNRIPLCNVISFRIYLNHNKNSPTAPPTTATDKWLCVHFDGKKVTKIK